MGFFDKIFGRKAPNADFSGARGAGSSTASPRPAAPPVTPSFNAPRRTYTVVSGDSLSKIAQREYGAASKWHAIYDANKQVIGNNPDLIKPGQVLVIPD